MTPALFPLSAQLPHSLLGSDGNICIILRHWNGKHKKNAWGSLGGPLFGPSRHGDVLCNAEMALLIYVGFVDNRFPNPQMVL